MGKNYFYEELECIKKVIIGKSYFYKVKKAAEEVFKELDSGCPESWYKECLLFELRNDYNIVLSEVPIPVMYKNQIQSNVRGFADIVIDNNVVLELKSVAMTYKSATRIATKKQCQRYKKWANYTYAIIINFPNKNENNEIYIEMI